MNLIQIKETNKKEIEKQIEKQIEQLLSEFKKEENRLKDIMKKNETAFFEKYNKLNELLKN
tara:strand:- start:1710 stop:1892 length:183 start_codon:yes stop_codon:yes gene_type:complete